MSLYVLIHLHEGTVEAAFVFPDVGRAIAHGVFYAHQSDFFVEGDRGDTENYAESYLTDHNCLISDVNEEDQLIIKRAFATEGSVTALKGTEP